MDARDTALKIRLTLFGLLMIKPQVVQSTSSITHPSLPSKCLCVFLPFSHEC